MELADWQVFYRRKQRRGCTYAVGKLFTFLLAKKMEKLQLWKLGAS